ncbi:hypothetical protein KIN20_005752 [Parelaphostrongylus tenuis]|uniref:Uncharacterized protein n=1 Tax=Parelaphostrongylus tenuis TaxID=148309 RepID=A0AAD5MJD2_PARTN|nr:hypothetical protein KIN20_005752 [Parelaphostrongylus tenuis]
MVNVTTTALPIACTKGLEERGLQGHLRTVTSQSGDGYDASVVPDLSRTTGQLSSEIKHDG